MKRFIKRLWDFAFFFFVSVPLACTLYLGIIVFYELKKLKYGK